MKIIDVRNHNNATINMSKRVKTKPKVRASDMTRKNVVDKESADRIAAAEAMSCLSSTPFILPSSSDVVKAVTGLDNKTEPQMNSVGDHDTSTAVPKRGKSKNCGRGSKRPLAKLPQTSSSSVEGNVSEINPIVFTTTSQGSSKHSTSQSNTIKFEEVNTSSPSQASLIAQQLSNLVKMQKEKQEKADAMPSHSNIKFSLQQMLELKMAQSHVQKSQNSSNSVLKLPLMVSPVERKQTRDTVSPSSVTSSESIELTQTTVDNILNSNKYDTPEASLPLKKRRLQTYKDGEVLTTESGLPSQGVADLTTSKQDQNSKEQQGDDSKKERSSSMFVNPQTSLMLMTEIQMALHQDEDGDLPLHIAVAQENIVMVQKFVHLMTLSGKNVDKYNKSQQTPLHLAVELQFDPAVSVLLMAGANPSLVNRQGDSAVHLAVKHNTIENLALMLIKSQHKADINARNFEGLSPLHLAVIKNQIEMVKVLIRCGADINIQDGKSGRTPLFYAVEGNQLALVMLFRQCNANLELTNYAGITALMAAQAKGFSEASSVLMVGLDPKAIIEHKEKEKLMMPNKKMPIPRIPSKAHLIVSETQRGIKKENNSENDNSSQGTSHESEDVQFKLEDRSDSPQMYDKNVREIQMQREAQSETLNFERKNASPQGASEPSSLQLTINVPVKKEKSKRNKQKKTSKNDNNSSSSVEISSSLTIPMGLPKGDVNCAADVGMTKASSEVSSQSVRPAIVSNTNPGSKPVSAAENLTSINARTASLLAAHLKGAKNLLSSNKHSSSYPLNLSCDGKGSAAMETNSTAVSNGS